MKDVEIFQNTEFGELRAIVDSDTPLFVASDVCRSLGLGNVSQSLSYLDADEKGITVYDTPGGPQRVSVVTEAGLYTLAIRSRKPKAKAFRRWITHEVLPAIRKHGIYATPDAIDQMLANPQVMIRTLQALESERVAREALQNQLAQDQPYAAFGRAIDASNGTITIGEFAKLACNAGLSMGRSRLFRWLKEHKYLDSYNRPYQFVVDRGLFELCERVETSSIFTVTMITGKGQMLILDKLLCDPKLRTEATPDT